ncbi:protein UXT protein [Trifolium repens]|nr:protein UXT protein [Trifolium repens]
MLLLGLLSYGKYTAAYKIQKYEEFVDKSLKSDLLHATAQRDKVFEQQKIFADLRRNIENLEKNSVTVGIQKVGNFTGPYGWDTGVHNGTIEFLSVAQNKLKSLTMASQPRLQVLAASKNRISTLKGFPYLPVLEIAIDDPFLNAFKSSYICSFSVFSFFRSCSGAIPKPLNLTEVVFPFVVFMAPFCIGISYACNTSCHETPGKIKEILAILESCRSSYSSSPGNTLCKNISPTINFFGKNQMDEMCLDL